jgi:predicted TIM-barrel fold metal-dependent hydrolase
LYRPRLDELWDIFGPDRLIFASDWPVSDLKGPYAQLLTVVRRYFAERGRAAEEKVFWKNSRAAYRWVKRQPNQP